MDGRRGASLPEDRTRCLLAGFSSHVPKPVEPLELVAVVGSLSGRTRMTNRPAQ